MTTWLDGPDTVLAPTSRREFLDHHWDDAPLVIQGRGPAIYEGLLSLEDIDTLIHQTSPTHPAFRLVKEGEELPLDAYTVSNVPWGTGAVSGFMNRESTRALMAEGCTFVMETCQRLHPSIGQLSRQFEQHFHCPSPVNLYVTPPSARGFQPHFDVQNVFVLQVHGTKRWQVFEPHIHRPLPSQAVNGSVKPGALLHDITLEPGDLLYIPRGFVHVAHTTDRLSAHLSVSLMPNTWADVFRSLLDSLPQDERFRTAVPLQPSGPAEASEEQEAAFESLMEAFVQGSDVEDALDSLGRHFVSTRLPHTAGQLAALDTDQTVTIETRLRKPDGIVWRVDADSDHAHLHFHGKTISAPWTAIQSLRWIANSSSFTAAEIPGGLGSQVQCQLAQHLVNEGFLVLD
jgi:ribosomal protein L16 Arg81 hydroxylase